MVDKLYTPQELANMLRVHRNTIYRIVQRQQIEFLLIGDKIMFTEKALQNYLDSRTVKAQPSQSTTNREK